MRNVVALFAVSALMVAMAVTSPTAQAQVDLAEEGGLDDNYDVGEPPFGKDHLCDDENMDEDGDSVLTCFVTKVTTDFGVAISTATFWGEFCDVPIVSLRDLRQQGHTWRHGTDRTSRASGTCRAPRTDGTDRTHWADGFPALQG